MSRVSAGPVSVLVTICVALAAACSDGDDRSPGPDPTWTPGPAVSDEFLEFVPEIQRALAGRDLDFFARHIVSESVDLAYAFSDGGTSLSRDDALALIASLWLQAAPNERDDFGGALPQVHVVGRLAGVDPVEPPPHGVMVTAIIEQPGGAVRRAVVALHWVSTNGGWSLQSLLDGRSGGQDLLRDDGGWFNPRVPFQP